MKYLLLIASFVGALTLPAAAQADPFVATDSSANPPLPCHARVAGLTGGAVAKDAVLDAGRLLLSGVPEGSSVASFRLTLVSRGMEPLEMSNPDNGDLTTEMRRRIAERQAGTKLYFEYIRMKGADGKVTALCALNFELN